MINREELIKNLKEGRKKWQFQINSMNDRELLEYYAWEANMRNNTNYMTDYILNGEVEDILKHPYKVKFFRKSLLELDFTEEKINRFLEALDIWYEDEGGGDFSTVTGIAERSAEWVWRPPSITWFATAEGFRWFCRYC